MKILVTVQTDENTFFTSRARAEIEKLGEVVYNPYARNYTKEELGKALEGIDIVFTGWGVYRFDEEVLSHANQLKLIAHVGGTVAPLQSDALAKSGILLLSGNRLYAKSVAEGTICYMLVALRKLIDDVNETREQGWCKNIRYTSGLWKKSIGLIGFGMIAQNVAKLLQPFDAKIKIYSSYLTAEEAAKYNAEVCSKEEIFETCDIVSIHSGLTDKTYHSIDKKYLRIMKDGALLVNTARGAIINEEDLIEELKKERIGAILDVYEIEPLPMESRLRELSNVILVPHKGGPTIDVRELVTLDLVEDLKRFINGDMNLKNIISTEYASRMTDESIAKK